MRYVCGCCGYETNNDNEDCFQCGHRIWLEISLLSHKERYQYGLPLFDEDDKPLGQDYSWYGLEYWRKGEYFWYGLYKHGTRRVHKNSDELYEISIKSFKSRSMEIWFANLATSGMVKRIARLTKKEAKYGKMDWKEYCEIMNTGWLSPSGEFIECEPRDHLGVADDIAQSLNIYDNNYNSDDVLLEYGWIRISILSFFEHGFHFSFIKDNASESQRLFLHDFYDKHRDFISQQGMKDLYYLGVIEKEELQ